ncbi:MAG: hypothetical protein KF825_09210 [Ferruginibacter sp.]|nr:hypothetical protein [Ferruginibacter sp.]
MIAYLNYKMFKRNQLCNWGVAYIKLWKCLVALLRFIFIMLLLLLPVLIKSQNSKFNYTIVQSGDNIGWLRLEKNKVANSTFLLLVSEIKTRFIFLVAVASKETSVFENTVLIHSTQYRKTNGTVKVNKHTNRIGDKYEVVENGEKQVLSIPVITTNLLSLYFTEPIGINTVYCDNYGCFSKISKTADGGFKVVFPDNNSNTFYYKNGICIKVKISHTFYSAEIIKSS